MVCVHYKKTSIYLCVGPKEPDFLVAFKFVMSNRSPGSLKVFKSVFFFLRHWLLFRLFSVQLLNLTIFRGMCEGFFFCLF